MVDPVGGTAEGGELVERLRRLIIQGAFAPGQRLPEPDISAQFQVGRTAVRAALAQLEGDGLVLRERNRGARVRPISLSEAVEITEVRAVVEGLCAAKAAQRAGQSDRDRLARLGAEMSAAVEAGDIARYSKVNEHLHHTVYELSGHGTARHVLGRLRSQSVRYQYSVAFLPGRPAVGLRQHLDIVDGICAGAPERAEHAMREHLLDVINALRELDRVGTALPIPLPPV